MPNFIEQIAPLIQKYAPQYGIKVCSPIIAQAILESGSGTSNKVCKKDAAGNVIEWRHNYFGLKWRNNRCQISNEYFEETTAEQNKDKSYTSIVAKFCKFKSMEDGVIGYFQWTNIANYSNLKGVTDPKTYLENIKADNYATSHDYVENVMNVIKRYNLTQYDAPQQEAKPQSSTTKYYRVQVGAYKVEKNAVEMQKKIKAAGFDCIIKKYGNLWKCQCGAFSKKSNAEELMKKVTAKGFKAFITFC